MKLYDIEHKPLLRYVVLHFDRELSQVFVIREVSVYSFSNCRSSINSEFLYPCTIFSLSCYLFLFLRLISIYNAELVVRILTHIRLYP